MAEEQDQAQANAPAGGGAAWALSAAGREVAEAYLKEQTRLARLQAEELVREDAIRHRMLRFVHFSTVMKVAFEISFALAILAGLSVVAAATWSAHEAKGLVIEAFQVPASLAERGLTGQVIASRLQDKFSSLQDQTDSLRAPDSFASNWGDDIKVEIPNTGVSIGEAYRYLRQWLGHETHITGEVWRDGDGVSVVARAGAEEGRVFAGKEADLDALLQKAAETVFEKTQPYRYADYLMTHGQIKPMVALLKETIATSPPVQQAWFYALWSNLPDNNGDPYAAIAMNRLAISLDASNALAWLNLAGDYLDLDGEEDELGDFTETARLARGRRSDINLEKAEATLLSAQSVVDEVRGEFATDLAVQLWLQKLPDYGGSASNAGALAFLDDAHLHDARAAAVQRRMAATAPADQDALLVFVQSLPVADALLGDWKAAVADHAALIAFTRSNSLNYPGYARLINARIPAAAYALALAQLGDLAGAEAAVRATPRDCDTCLRARGEIASLEKQWGRADFWFAAAERHAPSIPFADDSWGRSLLARGDYEESIAKFEAAHRKGPHFADPLERWGEALMAKNRSDLALAKFAEADTYAPNWGRLHLKWGEALWWSGDKQDAKTQFAAAAGLDLTRSETSELAGMRAAHG